MGKVRTPDGTRMAVCFCFDIDAMALWLGFFRSPTANPLSRGEFGPRVAMPRILDILDKYDIKATFFTPGHSARCSATWCRRRTAAATKSRRTACTTNPRRSAWP